MPHASRALTREARRGILLDDDALSTELDRMTDAHTDLIAARVAARAAHRPYLFLNPLSRLVVDPERFPDDREEMLAAGMGTVYTRTSHGEPLRRTADPDLVARHYVPYATAFADVVDRLLAATGRVVIIDLHSYPSRPLPYELHGSGPRPETCLGTDAFHTPPALLAAARQAFGAERTAIDTPFAGCYVPLRHYRRTDAVTAIMVELRRDTYLAEPAGPPHAGIDRVVEELTALVDAAAGPAG